MKAFLYYVCLFHEFERFLVKRIQSSILPFDLFYENKCGFIKKIKGLKKFSKIKGRRTVVPI